MDLREKKTRRNIKNAFLQVRAHKDLERITVKELSEIAEISKATFYLHYKDIFDLSNQLQQEIIQSILNSIIEPDMQLFDISQVAHKMFQAFHSQQTLIDILFSGTQSSALPISIERSLKEYAAQIQPDIQSDIRFNVLLSYQIYGSYYTYWENWKQFGSEQVLRQLDELGNSLRIKL